MYVSIPKTKATVEDPWLLSKDDLEGLGEELAQAWEDLEGRRSERLEQARTEALAELRKTDPDAEAKDLKHWRPYELEKSVQKCVFALEGGARVETTTVGEALKRRDILDKRVESFHVSLSSGDIEVAVDSRWRGLNLETKPDSDPLAQEIFERLLHWKDAVEQPPWVIRWKSWSIGAIILAMLPLYFLLLTFMPTDASRNATAWRQEAWNLLQDRLTPEEQQRAIEILLASQAQYPAPRGALQPSTASAGLRRLRIILLAAVVGFVVLGLPPRSTVGLGPGAKQLRRYRWWISFVSKAVPISLFATLVLDPFLTWLSQNLK
jgi:hypothetical protein